MDLVSGIIGLQGYRITGHPSIEEALILILLLFFILRNSRKSNRNRITMSVLRPSIILQSFHPFHSKKFQKEKQ